MRNPLAETSATELKKSKRSETASSKPSLTKILLLVELVILLLVLRHIHCQIPVISRENRNQIPKFSSSQLDRPSKNGQIVRKSTTLEKFNLTTTENPPLTGNSPDLSLTTSTFSEKARNFPAEIGSTKKQNVQHIHFISSKL